MTLCINLNRRQHHQLATDYVDLDDSLSIRSMPVTFGHSYGSRGYIWKSFSLFFVQPNGSGYFHSASQNKSLGKLVLALPNMEFSYILGLSAFCFSPLHHQEENDYGPKQSFRIPYDPKTTRIVAKVISPGAYQF